MKTISFNRINFTINDFIYKCLTKISFISDKILQIKICDKHIHTNSAYDANKKLNRMLNKEILL